MVLGGRFESNGKKEPRQGLKLMNAAAKKRSIGFEKNRMTAPRDGASQMRNAGMTQGLASPDPNDGRTAGNNFADPFVRNRMAGILMQDFRGIQELDRARTPRKTKFLGEAGSGDVRRQTQWEPHHAL
jgi:hypothetical protein